jgi:hypothetical protein
LDSKLKFSIKMLLLVVALGGIAIVLVSCAGVPYVRAAVHNGEVIPEEVVDYTIPPTGIVLWSTVETPDGNMRTEIPEGPLPIPGLPWWAQVAIALGIRAVATKSGRANLQVMAGSGQNLMARGSALVASTGVWSSPPEAVAKRATKEPEVASQVADAAV